MSEEKGYIYGKNAVLEALESESKIVKIFLCYGVQSSQISSIYNKAGKKRIQCVVYDKRKFGELEKNVCPPDSRSQGVIALRQMVEPLTVSELVKLAQKKQNSLIILLDEITDPHNLGAIARSAECAGAAGIILPERNTSPITPVAIKASAGALEHLPIAYSSNLNVAIKKLKDEGFWLIGTSDKAQKDYTEDLYDSPIGLVIGSEGSGIRQSVMKHCDILVKIPIAGKINSLNASVAAGVIIFEIVRQRTLKIK